VLVGGKCGCPAGTQQFQVDLSVPKCRCPGNKVKGGPGEMPPGKCICPPEYPIDNGSSCGCPTFVRFDKDDWEAAEVDGEYAVTTDKLNGQTVYARTSPSDMTLFYNGNKWQISSDNRFQVVVQGGSKNIMIEAGSPPVDF